MSPGLPKSPGLPTSPGLPEAPHVPRVPQIPRGSPCPQDSPRPRDVPGAPHVPRAPRVPTSQPPPAPPLSPAGISSVLFASRLGCLRQEVPRDTEAFIRAIGTMFGMTLLTMAMPKALHRLFPKPWRTFCEAWDFMFAFGEGVPGAGGGTHAHGGITHTPPGMLTGFCHPPPMQPSATLTGAWPGRPGGCPGGSRWSRGA